MLSIKNQALKIEEFRRKKYAEKEEAKYSKKMFSKTLGYKTVDSYSKMANGTKGLSLRTVTVFLENFNVDANWLFRGEGTMEKKRQTQKTVQLMEA